MEDYDLGNWRPASAPPDPMSALDTLKGQAETFASSVAFQAQDADTWAYQSKVEQAYYEHNDRVEKAIGIRPSSNPAITKDETGYRAELRKLSERFPDKKDIIGPDTDILAPVLDAYRKREDRSTAAIQRDPLTVNLPLVGPMSPAALAGGIVGSFVDPISAITNLIGPTSRVGRGAWEMAKMAAKQGVANAAVEAIRQPTVQQWRERAGLESGPEMAARNVAAAFLGGVVLDAGVRGAARGVRKVAGYEPVLDAKGGVMGYKKPDGKVVPADPIKALDEAAKTAPAGSLERRALVDEDPKAIRELLDATGVKLEDEPALRGALNALEIDDTTAQITKVPGIDQGDLETRFMQAIRAATDPDEPHPTPAHFTPPARTPDLSDEAALPAMDGDTTVTLYRGVAPGRDATGTGDTTGNALFYAPDRKVAEAYAGKDGTIIEQSVTFKRLLEAEDWMAAKRKLGLPDKATMADLINAARAAGHDGMTFRTQWGKEYIHIPGAKVSDGGKKLSVQDKPVYFRDVDLKRTEVDPEAFQFKAGGDMSGVTDRLRSVQRWDPVAAGRGVLFERADGKLIVADSHQRRGLAMRLADQETVIPAFVFREADGWTVSDVRALAAKKNLQEGSGSVTDMATVIRERPDIMDDSMPLGSVKMRQARSLARLSDEAFAAVKGGVVPPHYAAMVGDLVPDRSRHVSMIEELSAAAPANEREARLMVGEMMRLPVHAEVQMTLLGVHTVERSLMAERVKVLDGALQTLKTDSRVFGLLTREEGRIREAGNKLAGDENARRALEAETVSEVLERLAQQAGPVSSWLSEAAAAVAEGQPAKRASEAFARRVQKALEEGGLASLTRGPDPVLRGGIDDPMGPEAKARMEALEESLKDDLDDIKNPEKAAERDQMLMFSLPARKEPPKPPSTKKIENMTGEEAAQTLKDTFGFVMVKVEPGSDDIARQAIHGMNLIAEVTGLPPQSLGATVRAAIEIKRDDASDTAGAFSQKLMRRGGTITLSSASHAASTMIHEFAHAFDKAGSRTRFGFASTRPNIFEAAGNAATFASFPLTGAIIPVNMGAAILDRLFMGGSLSMDKFRKKYPWMSKPVADGFEELSRVLSKDMRPAWRGKSAAYKEFVALEKATEEAGDAADAARRKIDDVQRVALATNTAEAWDAVYAARKVRDETWNAYLAAREKRDAWADKQSMFEVSLAADEGRAKYFAKPLEMFARAFETYVLETAIERGISLPSGMREVSTYSAYAKTGSGGAKQIAGAFRKIFDGMRTDAENRMMFSLGDGFSQRRDLDSLGYYSQALEAARALKQAKGTPEQMRAQLRAAGVKEAELQATKLDAFLDGKKSVTRDEIVQHLEASRVTLTGVVRTNQPMKTHDQIALEMFGARLSDLRPSQRADVNQRFTAQDTSTNRERAKFTNYSLDPDNPTYRETVLHLPVERRMPFGDYLDAYRKRFPNANDVTDAEVRTFYDKAIEIPDAGKMTVETKDAFKSGHFPEPNIVGHTMTSMVLHEGQPVFLVDQIQSDWGQKLRDGGVRDEAKIADLRQQLDEAKKANADAYDAYQNAIKEKRPEAEIYPLDKAHKMARSQQQLIEAELSTAEASASGNPLVNTTDQWVDTTLRNVIRQAAEADAKFIAIPSGDTVLSYNPGDTDGMRGFYGVTRVKDRAKLAELEKQMLNAKDRYEELAAQFNPNTDPQQRARTARIKYEELRDQVNRESEAWADELQTGIVPKNLRKMLGKLDKESPAPTRIDTVDSPTGKTGLGKGFTLFPLTDAVKQRVLSEGQPLFDLSGMKPFQQSRAYLAQLDSIRSEVDDILASILPPDVRTRVEDRLVFYFGRGREEVQGYYSPFDKMIAVSLGMGDPRRTAKHEAVHALRDLGLMTDGEFDILYRFAEQNGMRKAYNIDEIYGKAYTAKTRGNKNAVEAALREEVIAHLVSDFMGTSIDMGGSRKRFSDLPGGAAVDRILEVLARFIERMRNMMAGRGFLTVEDVFQNIELGKMAQRSRSVELPGGMMVEGVPLFSIKAYHGTPNKFEPETNAPAGRFRLDKIGSGEGAQVFGHGLYFTESERLATYYRDKLSGGRTEIYFTVDGERVDNQAARELMAVHLIPDGMVLPDGTPKGGAKAIIDERKADRVRKEWGSWIPTSERLGHPISDSMRTYVEDGMKFIDQIVGKTVEVHHVDKSMEGAVYEVKIDSDDDKFLLWDARPGQQSDFVKEALRNGAKDTLGVSWLTQIRAFIGRNSKPKHFAVSDPLSIGAYISQAGDQKKLAEQLKSFGLDGIKYLDAQSRKDGTGTYNYVIFDDSKIEIVAKDGEPVTLASAMPDIERMDEAATVVGACRR